MTPPLCPRCSYLVSQGLPAGDCPACKRALVCDVAFNTAYRGLPLDRMAALLIALVAVVVALVADPSRIVIGASAAVLVAAGPYALFPRWRFTPRGRRRVRRASPGAAAAAATSTGATSRRPHLNVRT